MAVIKSGNHLIKSLNKHLSGFPTLGGYIESGKKIGQWEIKQFNLDGFATGYYSQLNDDGIGIALLKNKAVWMSITPMELEISRIGSAWRKRQGCCSWAWLRHDYA